MTRINALLGYLFSNGITTFCEEYGIPLASIDLVGTHTSGLRRFGLVETNDLTTHPLGWNAKISADIGTNTVFDFAVIEAGFVRPHVSPVAYVDKLFLRHPSKFRVCLSIGELINCSFIPPWSDENARGTNCRDCGPGSVLIDYAMKYCTSNDRTNDNDGQYATPGKPHVGVVTQYLKMHDYSRILPSLSVAREMFGDHEAQRLIDECIFLKLSEVDTIATVTRITAENILRQYRRLLALLFPAGQDVNELFISGPSARNANIIDYLEAKLPETVITKPLDDIGIPGDANEAVCYAHLAMEAVLGQPIRSSAEPSRPWSQPGHDIVLGRVVRGENWETLTDRLQKFDDGKPRGLAQNVKIVGSLESGIKDLGLK
jgi:1,6-anhydro-N-acetylmuramate kinase